MIGLRIKKVYRWIQAMSLDVMLGSGILTLAIAKFYDVVLPESVVFGLMIAVWTIYTFDHLSDAKKITKEASTYRHRFHQQHYKVLKYVLFLVILAGFGMALIIPPVVVKWGIICAACVTFYFLLLKLPSFWYKELLIAICYTIGVFLGPVCLSQAPLNPFQLLLIPQVFLLALANLVIFSSFDYQVDQQDGHYSLALHFGLSRTKKVAVGLIVANLVLTASMFFIAKLLIIQEVQFFIFVMNLLLLILILKEQRFRQHDWYRIVGDGAFFIPALFLLSTR